MTTQTHKQARLDSLTANRKPTWTWMAAAAGSAILAVLITLLAFESFSVVGFAILAGIFYVVSMYVISRVLEDRLKATDEFWRHLVWPSFFIAMVPLISVLWSVISQGLPTLLANPGLLTADMGGVVGSDDIRSEERRVGKEGRCRGEGEPEK